MSEAGEGCLDHELSRQMAVLVEQLTTSGSPSLDVEVMKKLKRICRTSDLYVEHAFRLLMTQLEKGHAEIRLSTFQIIDELFNRSHAFRELLVSDFQNFLELTVETDQDQPLPPPKAAAQKLRADTLKAVQQWHEKYSSGYKKLALGFNYLKTCKHVDFNDIRARSIAERRRIEEQELRKQKALQAKLEKVRKEITEMKSDMQNTAMEAENCIDLLLPRPESFLFSESDFSTPSMEQSAQISTKIPASDAGSSQRELLDCSASKENCDSKERLAESAETCTSLPEQGGDKSESFSEGQNERQCTACSHQQNLSSDTVCKCSTVSALDAGPSGESGRSNPRKIPVTLSETEANSVTPQDKEMMEVQEDSDSDGSFEDVLDEDSGADDEWRMVQAHGLGSRKYQLQIEIETDGVSLKETDDNRDLYRSLKDASCLVSMRYLPQVVKWLEVLGKTGGSQTEIKTMIDLKIRLEHIKSKCTELRLVPDANEQQRKDEESESDEDLEEVPEKEGYEPHIPSHLRAEYGLPPASSQTQKPRPSTSGTQRKAKKPGKPERRDSSGSGQKATSAFWSLTERNKVALVQDPTSRAANLAKLGLGEEKKVSGTGSSAGKPATVTSAGSSKVPTLPFGKDLAYWGNPDKIEAPTVVKNDSLHRFWVPAQVEHEKPSQHDVAAVMNRTFHYVGDFMPVKWKCRAKLPNGKLCERMDRVKCPFHGKIIARDQNGDPSNPEDVQVKEEKHEEPAQSGSGEVPPWLDAELQAEIEAATGHDLGSKRSKAKADKESKGKGKGKGRGKGKAKKYPGLTDIKEIKNTTRARLEAKVFNKSSLKRVANQLDAADYKRVRDKFANQFNYAYKA